MARKPEPPEEHGESAPMWIVSFADLVTLMLSFFVILAAGAAGNGTETPEFAELVKSLKAAFHNIDIKPEPVADPKLEFAELIRKLMALQKMKEPGGRKGDADNKGIYGKHFRVTRIRDGLEIAMGGPVFFEPFSATPTAEGERQLRELVDMLKGRRNVIEIRGHVGETPLPSDWNEEAVMRLAYDRAAYVGRLFRNAGIDQRAIRLVAVGANEPLKTDPSQPTSIAANRRVEIIIRESLIDNYFQETPAQRSSTSAAVGPAP